MSKRIKNQSNEININKEEYLEKKGVVTSFFSDSSYVAMTFKQLASILNVDDSKHILLEKILSELMYEGKIFIDDSKRYALCEKHNLVKCIYQAKSNKFGFGLVSDGEDIYIPVERSEGAIDKDDILVKITSDKSASRKKEGQVIQILKRNTKIFIGRYIKNENFGFVVPIDNKINDIYIPKKKSVMFKDGQTVEVEITKYATKTSKAEGQIISVVGDRDTPNIEVKALYKSYGLDKLENFSKAIENEISSISESVTSEEKLGRVDRTMDNIYTIDSEDAKDLDDAISVKKLDNGNYLLSVYIADVSYYVKNKTELNKEAILRGTSTYIPGTVIPMLPKKLSNGICSLNAGVDRLSLAVDMTIDNKGIVIDSNVFKALINVKKKMTYEKVYKVLNLEDLEVLKEYKDYEQDIFLMQELALILKEKRKEEGSIDFDIPDTKVVLDEEGNVEDIKPYEITIANKIIEEFMLIANMTIAEKFYFLDLPFIYRIHEKPDEEKLRELNEILSNYKKKIKSIKNIHPKVLATILSEITDDEEKKIVSTFMLRTLKLAKYSEECLGHFGLSAKYYCHFTSPIRRYPDLFIHRVISDYLDNGYILEDSKYKEYSEQAIKYAKSSSDTEKQATLIERDFDNLYTVMYMKKFIGHTFKAVVSSITQFGMFVKLENTAEGLVPFDNMPDNDYYIYDETRHILVGRNTSRVFKIGDKVNVRLDRADVKSKQLDFEIVEVGYGE